MLIFDFSADKIYFKMHFEIRFVTKIFMTNVTLNIVLRNRDADI